MAKSIHFGGMSILSVMFPPHPAPRPAVYSLNFEVKLQSLIYKKSSQF